MSSLTSISPLLFGQKPQAKLLSPVCRSLFGRSDTSVVTQMLNEIIVADQRRACMKLNFDLQNERPVQQEQQQENISEIDRTPEHRRRFHWRAMRDSDAPEFYSRRYKGKKSLMPVNLLECDESGKNTEQVGRSRTARRSLNGYLRSPSRHLSPKSAPVLRTASTSKLNMSPLRFSSPNKQVDSPVSFDFNCKTRERISVLRPLPVHASVDNVTTSRVASPLKRANNSYTTARSTAQERKIDYCARSLDFSDNINKSTMFKTTPKKNPAGDSSITAGFQTPVLAQVQSSAPRLTPATPIHSTIPEPSSRSLKQLKITDMVAIRKHRAPNTKARKRLALSSKDDSVTSIPSAKTPRLTSANI